MVYNFSGAGGGSPWAGLTEAPSGQLFGTTETGGAYGLGSVYALTPDGSGGFGYAELYAFPGGAQGANPRARLLLAADGYLYGTTSSAGISFQGTAFRIDFAGNLTTLHSFSSAVDGEGGASTLIQVGPALFGSAPYGGQGTWGTVFQMTTAGVVTLLHEFAGGAGGGIPVGGVVLGTDGAFYGVAVQGGAAGLGVVFRVDSTASFSVIHDFSLEDGGGPTSLALASDGFLYGTTQGGGANNLGTIFRVDNSGGFSVIHDFAAGEGRVPFAPLLDGGDGYLYGTNSIGSNANTGTVYRVTPAGAFAVLHDFLESEGGPPRGRLLRAADDKIYGTGFGNPFAPGYGLVYRLDADGSNFEAIHTFLGQDPRNPGGAFFLGSDGGFYGTSSSGGPGDKGTVFRFALPDSLTVVHAFSGGDGAHPGVLIEGDGGVLYGSASSGGPPLASYGVVFRVDVSGGSFSLLHAFDLSDGGSPSGLGLAPDQTLFGTTFYGGPGPGTIFHFDALEAFEVTRDFSFGDGAGPTGPLVWPGDGSFYGVTYAGGAVGAGTLYRVDGDGVFSTVRSFTGAEGQPVSVVPGTDGNFYGIAYTGGGTGYGGLFRVSPDGRGSPTHSFTPVDGGYPMGSLVLATDGNFYGVTQTGGSGNSGTVFRADPSGGVTTLHAFSGSDGFEPLGGLLQAPDGDLYGTTARGGVYGGGVIFRLRPPPSLALWSLVPSSGPASGGTPVDISGVGFEDGPSVTIGGVAATDTVFETASLVHATTPTLSPGTLNDLTVVNPNAVSGSAGHAWFADFLDVPQNDLFHPSVQSVFRAGVTAGCGAGSYCRDAPVTRAQMAVFLLKARLGPSYLPPPALGTRFLDVSADSFAAAWIEELVNRGITAGCGGGNYCPGAPVTRAHMAVFLLKARLGAGYTPAPATGVVFDDVPIDGFAAAWIEDLYARAITGGCSAVPPLYCPGAANTRGAMAVFLSRTFQLW